MSVNKGPLKLLLYLPFFFLDWGPVPHFCPLETLQPVWLTPEVYCIISSLVRVLY
jgi:hypothetical protein